MNTAFSFVFDYAMLPDLILCMPKNNK